MNVQSIVDYGLVIIFFIAMIILVPLVLARPEAQQHTKTEGTASSLKTSPLAYYLTAALFAVFIAITFISQKKQRETSSAQ
jgi:hypothetical protein